MLSENQSKHLSLLAQCINRKQITQQGVSLETGVHQSQISRILAGQVRRSSPNVLKLCKYAERLAFSETEEFDLDNQVAALLVC